MAKKVEIEQKEIEAPYNLPEGWKWVRLGEVVDCLDGFRKPINATERATREGNIPYYGATGQVGWINDYLTDEELVLLGEDGAPFFDLMKDKAYMISGKSWVNNHAHVLRSKYGEAGNKYLLNYLNSFNYTGYVNGTTRLKLTQGEMLKIPFPLPPTLAEQRRIVNRIENMFAKLDEAKEKARSAADSFETRRAAILHQAFTGSLTAKWRKENGVSDDSWKTKRFDEVYTINPKVKADDDILASFIPMEKIEPASVNRFSFDVKHWGNIKKNHTQFQNGDVCFAKISPCFENGKAFIANGLENGIGAGTTELIILRSSEVDVRYTFYVVTNTSFVRGCCTTYSGTVGQQRISMDYVRNYKIPVPTLPEQQEIVRILDTVLEKERTAKSAAEQVLEQIDLLKKSILVRAFRGEL